MGECKPVRCTAFAGSRCVASGELAHVARKAKETLDGTDLASILIFDDATSEPIEVDFRGTVEDVLRRLAAGDRTGGSPRTEADRDAPRGPGRPRLGVVSREVTLLPRHWEWLNRQSGGASAALRRLVEEARRVSGDRDGVRDAQGAAHRFMSAMAGNLPGFEEALRALFAGDADRFEACVSPWPPDIRDHARRVSGQAFPQQDRGQA